MKLSELMTACPNIQIIPVGFRDIPRENHMTLESQVPERIERKPYRPRPIQQAFLLWEPDSLFGSVKQ